MDKKTSHRLKLWLLQQRELFVKRDTLLKEFTPEDIQFAFASGWIKVGNRQDKIVYTINI